MSPIGLGGAVYIKEEGLQERARWPWCSLQLYVVGTSSKIVGNNYNNYYID
jgi:hypothetical protein